MRKRFYFLALLALVFSAGCATPADSISHLAAELSQTYGLWQNGTYPTIDLPPTASTEGVLTKVFEGNHFAQGAVTSHKIVETRAVRIGGEKRTAVMVDTNLGREIVLLQYQKQGGWWSRVYDESTS